jgi:sugar-specific transcriptional regulator TrmB
MESNKTHFKYTQNLQDLGLLPEEALIYQALLEKSPLPARKISLNTSIGRSMVYKMLDLLLEKNLITKEEKDGKIATFSANHPQELKQTLKNTEEALQKASSGLEGIFGNLVSSYNLLEGKPNIQFFEGEKGMKEILDDSLYSKEHLRGITDLEAIEEHIPEINAQYKKDREKYGVHRDGIILKTPKNIELAKKYSTESASVRLLPCTEEQCQHLNTVMNIYDGKVSYLTLSKDHMIGVIIEDKNIYHLHRFLFDTLWANAEKLPE